MTYRTAYIDVTPPCEFWCCRLRRVVVRAAGLVLAVVLVPVLIPAAYVVRWYRKRRASANQAEGGE